MPIILAQIVFAAIVAYPLWIIFKRAGLNPYLTALVFIPYIGFAAVAVALGTMQWNTTRGGADQ